ncbi:hypothetical protein Tco_1195446 [Tanacetum coccineum]
MVREDGYQFIPHQRCVLLTTQVIFATETLQGAALTWWITWYCETLGEIKKLEIELWNLKVKVNDVGGYTKCFQELALMCTKFLSGETEKVDKYISGLPDNIHGNLELPQELSRVHNTFHVSNLKKCYSDDPLVVPLEGLQVDDKLHFVEEPVEIMDREVKQLRRSRVPIVKVRWNSRRGPEFTWEREDQFRKKYPHLFTKIAPSSNTVMSDSEDSTVTYTAVSSPFEDGSDIGSPGVDGPPIMPEDPYAYIMAAYC